jgi:hypothetical protein
MTIQLKIKGAGVGTQIAHKVIKLNAIATSNLPLPHP